MDYFLVVHLIIGPVLLLIAFLTKAFPPKSINFFYGYRTPRSMRSQESWEEANRYAANAMIKLSFATIVFQLIVYPTIGGETSVFIILIFFTIATIALIIATEKHLKRKGF